MERPRGTVAPAEDCYDHELSQAHANFLAFVDALLEHKNPNQGLTYVDIAVEADPEYAYTDIAATRIGSTLTGDDEQLAEDSTGEYYPVLDVKKMNATLTGVSVRAWGWDFEKIRYTDVDQPELHYPRPHIVYEGQSDRARQLDVTFQFTTGGHYFSESICVSGSSDNHDGMYARNNIWIADYAEMGYEGNGRNSIEYLSEEDIDEFMEVIARIVGDKPVSFVELAEQRVRELIDRFAHSQFEDVIGRMIAVGSSIRAEYELMGRRHEELGGTTVAEALSAEDISQRAVAVNIVESRIRLYESWHEESRPCTAASEF